MLRHYYSIVFEGKQDLEKQLPRKHFSLVKPNMVPRLYFPHALHTGQQLDPGKEVRRYLLKTLRLTPCAPLVLFNGQDPGEWQGSLTDTPLGHIQVLAFKANQRESPLHITLVQGLSKTHAMELTVQKAVELGVARIIPLLCRRSSSNPGSGLTANRQRRLLRIAVEAAEQSGRIRVPEITPPVSWQALGEHLGPGPRWLFWEEGRHPSVNAQPDPGQALTLLVGPEGGMDDWEASFAREQLGCITLGLGPRILRAETAAMAVVAACQMLWGDLGGRGL